MADYKEMYLTLFRKVNKAIALLQDAGCETEEMLLSLDEAKYKELQGEENEQTL